MAVEQVVMSVMRVILDWLSVAIVLCIIYMLFALVTNGKGLGALGNLFKGRDGDDSDKSRKSRDRDTSTDKKKTKKKEEDEDDADEKERKKKKEYVDFENLGQIRFLVRNRNDEPIEGARVVIYPSKAKIFFKKIGKKGRYYTDKTNRDGIFPSHGGYLEVPSGTLKYIVRYTLPKGEKYKSAQRFGRRKFKVKSDIEIKKEESHDVSITLDFYSESQEGFEPFIHSITPNEDKTIEYKGIIKPL